MKKCNAMNLSAHLIQWQSKLDLDIFMKNMWVVFVHAMSALYDEEICFSF